MPGVPGVRAAGDPIVPVPPDTTLSYDQSSQLMLDLTFRGRVKTACLKFADYIMNEAPNTPAHISRMNWASNCFKQPDMVAVAVQNPVVMDASVQSAGSAITDAALQSAVETTVGKMM